MLSVLIPVYNIDCSVLVEDLLLKLNDEIPYEIICIDDASTMDLINFTKIKNNPNVKHFRQETNLGRSSIRNLLVEKSKYPWLLFLDADTLPVRTDFIQKYVDAIQINPDFNIFFGGIQYRSNDLNDSNHLRYRYGMERESNSVEKRNKTPHLSMLMSNTLVHRSIFEKVQLNPIIKKYGHEDAVFSYDLYKKGYKVKHIDNPIYHTGIESNDIFLEKTKIAVENLLNLYELGILNPKVNKLLQTFLQLKSYGITSILSKIYQHLGSRFENKLNKENPSLFLFDMCRLSYLSFLYHSKKQKLS